MGKMQNFLSRENALEFIKYIFASALALVVDYASYSFLAINQFLDLPSSAVVGYAIGLILAYFMIADGVFKDGWLMDRKRLEAFLFFL